MLIGAPTKSADEKSATLLSWFTQNGGFIDADIETYWSAENGFHFRARKDIGSHLPNNHSNQKLCQCPSRLSLSCMNLTSSDGPSSPSDVTAIWSRHLIGKVDNITTSYVFLAEQKLLGAKSFWAPYFDALPSEQELETPLWFDEADLKWLLGTNMHTAQGDVSKSPVENRRQLWRTEFERVLDILKESNVQDHGLTWPTFLWAATIFTSRAFTSRIHSPNTAGDEVYSLLYPVIDIFNHRFGAKVTWQNENGDFSLITSDAIKKGEQIYNNYAPKGNEELLMGYGFCIEGNPCDQFAIRLGKPPEEVYEALCDAYPHQFSSETWTPETSTFYLRGSGHYSGGYEHDHPSLRGIPPELFGAVNGILSYTNEDLDGDQLVNASIATLIERFIAKRDAIQQNTELLPTEPENSKQRYAKIYRDGQLAILSEIIAELKAYFDD